MANKKTLSAASILAIVFSVMGVFYTVLGYCLYRFPEDPESEIVGQIFVLIGIGMLCGACIALYCHFRRRKQIEQLVENGQYIWCQIVDILPNTSVTINNRHPYFILCQYTDHCDHTYQFKSCNLKYSPDRRIIGQQVRVYYLHDNFKPYYVELSRVLPDMESY